MHDPETLREWLERAVDGGHQSIPEQPVSFLSMTFLLMAFGVHQAPDDRLPDAFVQALVRAIRKLPIKYRTPGYDPILGAVDALLMHFADADDRIRLAVFRAATRRLPSLEQCEAIKVFVTIVEPKAE